MVVGPDYRGFRFKTGSEERGPGVSTQVGQQPVKETRKGFRGLIWLEEEQI